MLAGCTHVKTNEYATAIVYDRINKDVYWQQCEGCNEQIKERVALLLAQDLTVDSAVQIALLNNPEIQATFEEIGIAQADLIEAGLLTNPVFDAFFRIPDRKGLHLNFEGAIVASFLDIFLIPLRTKVAGTELEAIQLRVSNQILNLSFEVQKTFYEIQTAQEKLTAVKSLADIARFQYEIATRQNHVGNINALNAEQMQSRYFEAKLEISTSQMEIIRLREHMNKLLGICDDNCWTASTEQPESFCIDYDMSQLQCIAFQQRLDLHSACLEASRLCQMLGLKEWWAYTNLGIGFAAEQDTDGTWDRGPCITGSIPIFNYGQAARARLYAQLRQAQDRIAALEIRACTEVNDAYKRMTVARDIINEYRIRILPMQDRILDSTTEIYSVMGFGVNVLLESKRQELLAKINYSLALRNYYLAKVDLDKAIGGGLHRCWREQ